MKILITGVAGFIGFHLAKRLLKKNNCEIIGIDNLSNYYDVSLKKNRLNFLNNFKYFTFQNIDISIPNQINKLNFKFDLIINLAAQAGVNYSFKNPGVYINSNIIGFNNILNLSKKNNSKLIYASSSSVYGNNKTPFDESMLINKPINLYASTKIYNESIAAVYSQNYDLNIIGLRFFTVYGSWGRPDMFMYKAIDSAFNNKTIELFNNGENFRDFTHIDDIIDGIELLISSKKPFANEIFNISNGKKYQVKNVIDIIQKQTKKNIKTINKKALDGDMKITFGSNKKLKSAFGFKPKISINEGINEYVSWFKKYYKI